MHNYKFCLNIKSPEKLQQVMNVIRTTTIFSLLIFIEFIRIYLDTNDQVARENMFHRLNALQ